MKLLTQAIIRQLPPLGDQDGKGDEAIAYVKFFCLRSDHRWFGTEYDPETRQFFGLVTNHGEAEWGYFSLDELAELKFHGIPAVERDLHFKPSKIAEVKRQYSPAA